MSAVSVQRYRLPTKQCLNALCLRFLVLHFPFPKFLRKTAVLQPPNVLLSRASKLSLDSSPQRAGELLIEHSRGRRLVRRFYSADMSSLESEIQAKTETAGNRSSPPFKLILGSSSMSRQQILAKMGYEFTIITADINEKGIRREKPEDLVMVLAEAKADAIIARLQNIDYNNDVEPTLLITSDIVVVHEGVILEKPSSKEEARQFVKGYSGGHASTVGSVLITNLKTGTRKGACDKAEVYFHDIPDDVIDNLIEEGVVFNVAGGLLLEHPLTLPFVEAVVGTADSVMGLPKALTEKLIQEAL